MFLAIFGVPALLLAALIIIVIIGAYKSKKKIIRITPPFEDERDWGRH